MQHDKEETGKLVSELSWQKMTKGEKTGISKSDSVWEFVSTVKIERGEYAVSRNYDLLLKLYTGITTNVMI